MKLLALACLMLGFTACQTQTQSETELLHSAEGARTRAELETALDHHYRRYYTPPQIFSIPPGPIGAEIYRTPKGVLLVSYLWNSRFPEEIQTIDDLLSGDYRMIHDPHGSDQVEKVKIFKDNDRFLGNGTWYE